MRKLTLIFSKRRTAAREACESDEEVNGHNKIRNRRQKNDVWFQGMLIVVTLDHLRTTFIPSNVTDCESSYQIINKRLLSKKIERGSNIDIKIFWLVIDDRLNLMTR